MNRRHFCKSSIAAAVAVTFHPQLALATEAANSPAPSDVNAITADGAQVTLRQSAVQELADSLRGDLLLPGSEAYEQARLVLNPSFDKYPALVVRPLGAADVSTAVQFARQENLLTAVKGGGHSYKGLSTCNGGMQIDLSRLRHVRVDPDKQTAWVAGGSLLGEMDFETMAHGLVTTSGSVSHTGVGGLTLGAGFGRLMRKYGLAIDNVLSVDIVTSDGTLRRASADENPDLYWAVRGGGGNFGVVTAFEFQLHPMDRQVISGSYGFPFEQARDILAFAGDFSPNAPDELVVTPFLGAFPGQDTFLTLSVVYCGPHDKADAILAPVEKAGTVVRNSVETWDYVALQKSGDIDDPRANTAYMRSGFVDEMTPGLAQDIVETFQPSPDRATLMVLGSSGGAISRVPGNATAFPHRDANHNLLSFVQYPTGAESSAHIQYMEEQWKVLGPHTNGFYVNDLSQETQAEVDVNYGANLERLVRVKNQYDPSNLFRLNANIQPTV